MLEIIKYQLKGRKNNILLLLAIFGILNVIAYGMEISGIIANLKNMNSGFGFWIVIAIATTVIATMVTFFLSSTGHVRDLLYKESSYLMLTVPRHGWEILGGRFIAGLIEFLACAIPAGFLLSIHAAIILPTQSSEFANPLMAFITIYKEVFIVNFIPVAQILLLGLCAFAIVGTFITFAVVASRSFVKNKGIATAVSIAVFVTVINLATQWGSKFSRNFNWYWNIDSFSGMMNNGHIQSIPVPVASLLFFFVIAAALFAAASWLMEKKVEL